MLAQPNEPMSLTFIPSTRLMYYPKEAAVKQQAATTDDQRRSPNRVIGVMISRSIRYAPDREKSSHHTQHTHTYNDTSHNRARVVEQYELL